MELLGTLCFPICFMRKSIGYWILQQVVELKVVHDNLLSRNVTFTTSLPPSWALPEDSQPSNEGQEVILVLRLVTKEAMLLKQLQHILGLY